ncbi:MAG: hypothetical protein P8X50_10725 [Maritimibacter sp.]
MKIQPTASPYISGRYVEDTSGTTIKVNYPASGEVISTRHSATYELIEQGLAGFDFALARHASAAFCAGMGATEAPIEERSRQCRQIM